MMLRSLMEVSKAVAHTYATWNPADKSANITLSGGNLVATVADVSDCAVRSTVGKSTGKWYWENTFTSGTTCVIAIGKSTATLANCPGSDANGWMYYSLNGQIFNGAGGVAYGATFAAGDVVGVALDMTAGTLVFYKNGVSQGTAFTGLSGTFFAMTGRTSAGVKVVTANFGATALVYSPPTGFNTGLYI